MTRGRGHSNFDPLPPDELSQIHLVSVQTTQHVVNVQASVTEWSYAKNKSIMNRQEIGRRLFLREKDACRHKGDSV